MQYSRAVNRLPVECWHEILRQAISVPFFFDVDPLETNPAAVFRRFYDEAPYWESEKTRTSLKLVCSFWNAFLEQYDYRYIKASHHTRNVPPEALQKAVRISLDMCRCSTCTDLLRPSQSESRYPWHDFVLSVDHGDMAPPWNVRILDVDSRNHADPILSMPSRLSNVRIISYTLGMEQNLFLVNPAQNIHEIDLAQILDTPNLAKLMNITTLHCHISHIYQIHLPQLRHLSIEGDLMILEEDSIADMLDWLRAHGKQLFTLFWPDEVGTGHISCNNIWTLCPNLRHIGFPCDIDWSPPNDDHQLSFLRLQARGSMCRICGKCRHLHLYEFQFQHCIPQLATAKLPTLGIPFTWRRMMSCNDWTIARQLIHDTSLFGVRLVDISGYTFSEAIIAVLEAERRGRRSHSSRDVYCDIF